MFSNFSDKHQQSLQRESQFSEERHETCTFIPLALTFTSCLSRWSLTCEFMILMEPVKKKGGAGDWRRSVFLFVFLFNVLSWVFSPSEFLVRYVGTSDRYHGEEM